MPPYRCSPVGLAHQLPHTSCVGGFRYGILFVVSIVAVFAWPAKGVHLGISWEQFRSYVRGILSVQGQVKEKVDLDNEWEMVWDAEGAMHLLSKAQAKIPDSSQGLSSDVRSGPRLNRWNWRI